MEQKPFPPSYLGILKTHVLTSRAAILPSSAMYIVGDQLYLDYLQCRIWRLVRDAKATTSIKHMHHQCNGVGMQEEGRAVVPGKDFCSAPVQLVWLARPLLWRAISE